MTTYTWTKDDLAGQEWAEQDYLNRKRERLARAKAARQQSLEREVKELRAKLAQVEAEREAVTA